MSPASKKKRPTRVSTEQGASHFPNERRIPNKIGLADQTNSKPRKRGQIFNAKGTGYKSHRVGSRKERAHQLFDTVGPDKARQRVLNLGIKPNTIGSWFSEFRKTVGGGS
jgi:hypothetical protein